MVEAVGAGSVWNQNSWHWEEKNYTVQAKAFLTEHLAKIEFDAPEPASSVKLYETKSVEGSCSITIRKGKQIVLFDFSMDAYFKATSKTDEEETAMGTIQIHEFNQDDDEVDITVTNEKQNDFCSGIRRVLTSDLVKKPVFALVKKLKDHLISLEGDAEKLRSD